MKAIAFEDEDFEIPEFDFTRAVSGEFAERCEDGTMWVTTNIMGEKKVYVSLDADIVEKSLSPKWVNEVLRQAIKSEAKERAKAIQK